MPERREYKQPYQYISGVSYETGTVSVVNTTPLNFGIMSHPEVGVALLGSNVSQRLRSSREGTLG